MDLRRAVFSGRFLLGVALGVAALYQPAYPFSFFGAAQFAGNTLTGAIQDTFGLGFYIMCCAVLCALPYADAHAWEAISGEYPYILSRTGTKTYILSKVLATALSGGLVLFASFLIFCLVQVFAFAPSGMDAEDWRTACSEGLALFSYGACWSLCGLCLSAWLASPFVVLALPFFVTRFLWLFTGFTGWNLWNPSSTIQLIGSFSGPPGIGQIAIQELSFSFLFVTLFVLGVNRKKC
jgi:hypothetical protein